MGEAGGLGNKMIVLFLDTMFMRIKRYLPRHCSKVIFLLILFFFSYWNYVACRISDIIEAHLDVPGLLTMDNYDERLGWIVDTRCIDG